MATSVSDVISRIREMRRRHFGPGGKAEFARRLAIPPAAYDRIERGKLPPGELMVRMCEVTGEELQWLLTGTSPRRTMVISSTGSRNSEVLVRTARLLEQRPELARPIDAFLDLLDRQVESPKRLPAPRARPAANDEWIPILDPGELSDALPLRIAASRAPAAPLNLPQHGRPMISEPTLHVDESLLEEAQVATRSTGQHRRRLYLRCPMISTQHRGAFAVRLTDNLMSPMFESGDAAISAPKVPPRVGSPVLCKVTAEPGVRCRVWLGERSGRMHLGRLADGRHESLQRGALRWLLGVLFRLSWVT
jgi:hypothetical protein